MRRNFILLLSVLTVFTALWAASGCTFVVQPVTPVVQPVTPEATTNPKGVSQLSQDIQSINENTLSMTQNIMGQVAKHVNLDIDIKGTATTVKDDSIVSVTSVLEQPDILMLTYLSLTGACAEILSPDFYIVKEFTDPATGNLLARFVNLEGKALLDVPLTQEEMQGTERIEKSSSVSASIEETEAGEQLISLNRHLHGDFTWRWEHWAFP